MPPARRQKLNAVQLYLVAFNVVSALGWGYILILTLVHLFNLDGKAQLAPSPNTASSHLSRFFSTLSLPKVIKPPTIESRFPSYLQPLYQRATTLFYRVGPQTALVQTFAVLEVFHVLLGWVRSPIQTTAMQVSSRLFLIWGITEQFPAVCSNPLYASMVLSWALTEVVRYSFYACGLIGVTIPALLYLRYTMFYVLYPTGASSEAFLIYAALPAYPPYPGWQSWLHGMWKPADYVRACLFMIWSICHVYSHDFSKTESTWAWNQKNTMTRDFGHLFFRLNHHMTWTSSSHFRHPWFVSKRKRCETPVDDPAETVVSKRRRQCNTLEHGFAYLSIENPITIDVPWTSLANDSCSSSPVDFSAMDSDMLPPQPVYIVEEPTVPEVDMKASSWYEPEPDRIVITDLDLFTESDDEREREREESVDINPILLDCIRNKELGGKSSPHPKATSTALVLFKPLPGIEQLQREGETQAKAVDENAMDLEP